jgi:hypothetical protein
MYFLKLIVMLWPDQVLPSLHSENNLNVDLGVRIRHFYAAPTELGVFLVAVCYKYVAPNGAAPVFGRVWLQICRSYGATNHPRSNPAFVL